MRVGGAYSLYKPTSFPFFSFYSMVIQGNSLRRLCCYTTAEVRRSDWEGHRKTSFSKNTLNLYEWEDLWGKRWRDVDSECSDATLWGLLRYCSPFFSILHCSQICLIHEAIAWWHLVLMVAGCCAGGGREGQWQGGIWDNRTYSGVWGKDARLLFFLKG